VCIYRINLTGRKNVNYVEKFKQQGTKWVRSNGFLLFGTATFKDGSQISDTDAASDTQHFFNIFDIHILSRKQTAQGTRLDRLVFLEHGRLGANVHINFFIKGTNLKHFKAFLGSCAKKTTSIFPKKSKQVFHLALVWLARRVED
jgi:hypothetical protein